MEDAATCEICRTQVWQWVNSGAKLSDGRTVTPELVRQAAAEELEKLRQQLGAERFGAAGFKEASQIFATMMTSADFPEFLTLVAYDHID
jgi:malate synthase